ncbi:MAG TPA: glycerophosphoryl diester phosphodiesterase membrane domain-containing protein [Actinomycetota bacterium]
MSERGLELRARTVGEILTDAFEVYRRNFFVLVSIAAVVVVPLTLFQYLLFVEVADVWGATPGEIRSLDAAEAWRVTLGGFALGLISFVVSQLATGAGTHAVVSAVAGGEPGVGVSYRAALGRLGSLLLATLLMGLAVGVGFVLFIIPGFIVLVRLIATIPAVVVERATGGRALSRSWELVRGRSWPVFGAMLVVLLVTGILTGIVTRPVGDHWFAQGLAASIASVLTAPYVVTVVVLLYLDLRVRKEGLDPTTLRHELVEGRGPA